MTPWVRRVALTAHITASVGWIGAVACFLALAVAGLTSSDDRVARAAYLAMELTGWFVIVPLSFAAPITGIVQALGTAWGLFRHYWVLVKFLITIPCTVILLLHMQPTTQLAAVAAETTFAGSGLGALQIQLVADSIAAMVVLVVATTLAVYKPPGLTPYGARRRNASGGPDTSAAGTPVWVKVFGALVLALVVLFLGLHITGHGLGGHH